MKRGKICRDLCAFLLFGFLLGVHKGQVALWKDGQSIPWKVFPYPVAALPVQTQRALEKGIVINSMEQLDKALENLLS